MVNILRRRELVIPNAPPGSEWDLEWDYTQGMPTEKGFVETISNVASATMGEDGVILSVKNNSPTGSIRYEWPTFYSKSVMEVNFKSSNGTGTTNIYWIFALSNGNGEGIAIRCQTSANYQGIYLSDNATFANMTKLAGFSKNTVYTIKLVLDGDHGEIYRNGTLLTTVSQLYPTYGTINGRVNFYSAGSQTYKSTKFHLN